MDNEYRVLLKEKLASMEETEKNAWIEKLFQELTDAQRRRFLPLLEKESQGPVDGKEIQRFQRWISEVEQGVHYFSAYAEEDEDPWDMDWGYEDPCSIATGVRQGLALAKRLFLQGAYAEALRTYNALTQVPFQAVNEELEETLLLDLEDILYEGLVEMPYEEVLLHQMASAYHALRAQERVDALYGLLSQPGSCRIRIEEVLALDPPSMAEKSAFLEQWQAHLRRIPGQRAQELLSEAAMLQGGIQRLVELARADWEIHPGLYMDACGHLWGKGLDEECTALGKEAMETLPVHWTLRAAICEITASSALRREDWSLVSRCWESAFYSHSSLVNYLRLFRLPQGIAKAEEAMRHALALPLSGTPEQRMETNTITPVEQEVLRFFSGDFQTAQRHCQADGNTLGWSTSLKGILVPLFLLAMQGGDTYSKAQDILWREILWKLHLPEEEKERMLEGYTSWKASLGFTDQQVEQHQEWIRQEVERRVDAVVGGGYRKSYFKAALLVQNYGEMLESRGMPEGARQTVEAYCKRHPRKRAFRSEFLAFATPE